MRTFSFWSSLFLTPSLLISSGVGSTVAGILGVSGSGSPSSAGSSTSGDGMSISVSGGSEASEIAVVDGGFSMRVGVS